MDDKEGISEFLDRDIQNALFAPFLMRGRRIRGLLKHPDFKFGKIVEIEREGRKLIEFEFTLRAKDRMDFPYEKGTIAVSPSEGWVARRQEVGVKQFPRLFEIEVDYQPADPATGIPLPKVAWERDPYSVITRTYDELVHEAVPNSQFTLTAFGMPDINKPIAEQVPGQAARWYYWAAGLAVAVAIGLRVYLARVAKQTRQPA